MRSTRAPYFLIAALPLGCTIINHFEEVRPAIEEGGRGGEVSSGGDGALGAKGGARPGGASGDAGHGGLGTGGAHTAGDAGAGGAACPTSGPDRCDVADDDSDCNGVLNEGCPCIGDASQACNECGVRVCDPANRSWGECHAADTAEPRCADGATLETCGADGNWSATPCPNADLTHCRATCKDGATDAECGVVAVDGDLDDHGTTACTAAPGTDCDDENGAVYPGAAEICDGVDNDCNGRADLNDGLQLGGSMIVQPGYGGIQLAWSPELGGFGMVAQWSAAYGLFYGTLSTAGAATWRGTSLFVADGTMVYAATGISWSPNLGKFGVVYDVGGMAGSAAVFRLVTVEGVPAGSYSLYSGSGVYAHGPSITTRASGDLVVAHAEKATATVRVNRLVSDFDTLVDASVEGEAAVIPRIATSGDLTAVVWQVDGSRTINWVRLNASTMMGSVEQLTSNGSNPSVAGSAAGYATAWSTLGGFQFQRLDYNGELLCGPVLVPFGTTGGADSIGLDLEISAYGTLALASDYDAGQVSLFRIADDCSMLDEQPVYDSPGSCGGRLAVGSGYVALALSESNAGATGHLRIMGERLCD